MLACVPFVPMSGLCSGIVMAPYIPSPTQTPSNTRTPTNTLSSE